MKSNINSIESVHQYITRRLTGLSQLSYLERLNVLGLETLESLRIKSDPILLYKVLNNQINVNISDSIQFSESSRDHNKHLYHLFNRTETGKNFWVNHIVNVWNNLDSNVVNSKNLNCLKVLSIILILLV